MKNILGMAKETFVKKYNKNKTISIALAVVTLVINVALCFLRNDANHKTLLFVNIALDVVVGWFEIAFLEGVLFPQKKLLGFYNKNRSLIKGEVCNVSSKSVRIQGVDCLEVTVGRTQTRKFFVPCLNAVDFTQGQTYQFAVVGNVIVEWTK